MTETKSAARLLLVALQDLYDAEQAWIERLPALARTTTGRLAGYITDERARAALQAGRLETLAERLGESPSGAPNIWLRAILDDADRDAQTIAAGALRNIALTGAFRKGKQSERVSYETAIGLAERLGDKEAADAFIACRDEEQAADATLALVLAAELQET
jgi:ferritin-like metal-binding protein YciE